jgi:hypothetical protein
MQRGLLPNSSVWVRAVVKAAAMQGRAFMNMNAVKPRERRRSSRCRIDRIAKIQLGTGTLPRDCRITDISTGGVRLHAEGLEVPTDFVLFLFGENLAQQRNYQECNYEVVWRLDHEIGARFVGLVRRNGAAAEG